MNECAFENGGCMHECLDTLQSYQCICNDGYTLDKDGHSCYGKFLGNVKKAKNTWQCTKVVCFFCGSEIRYYGSDMFFQT